MRFRFQVLLSLGLAPGLAVGQSVAVRVSGQPAGGALVGALASLQDLGGTRVVQTLTDERGRATLTAPRPGRYRLRVDAIGYQGTVSNPIDLQAGLAPERVVTLEAAPLNLNELVVASTRPAQCELGEARGTAAARLWDEAHKALTGTQITSARPMELEVKTFERRLDTRSRIVSETSDARRATTARPFASIDPDSLSRFGYVQERADGLWFHGPDADLLLSEQFLDDHCFRPANPGPDSSLRVGLEFQPSSSRSVPDISGVLWLDAKTLELRDLQYTYTGVEWPQGTLAIGGRIEFVRLASGGWIVGAWSIRMPVTRRRLVRVGQRDSVAGYREAGGSARAVADLPPVAGATAVVGTVFDSLRARPLAGAVVSLQQGAFADTTDQAGRYRIVSPGTGDYLLTVEHPGFPLVGLAPLRASAQLRRGQTDTTDVATPGLVATLRRLCRLDQLDSSRALLVGIITDSLTGQALADAMITVSSDIKTVARTGRVVSIGSKGTQWEITPGSNGAFQVCGVPRGRPLDVHTKVPGRGPIQRRMGADTVAIRELIIRHPE
ncbi:MAG: carboxypeptidase regulatory-like domain-containing protein [Gemmatimonadetes bacterium]|nr:carboxypeptidase regulatory-like domain-containing protein [Gemmatimonadota bacterium]